MLVATVRAGGRLRATCPETTLCHEDTVHTAGVQLPATAEPSAAGGGQGEGRPRTPLLLILLLLLQLTIQTHAQDNSTKVIVKFQANGRVTKNSWLKYLGEVPELYQATFCFSIWLQRSRDSNTVISYAVPAYSDEVLFRVNFDYQTISFRCCDGHWRLNIRQKVVLREWMSVCLAVDLVEQKWKAATNGKVRYGGHANRSPSPVKIREGGNFIIGQDQDSFDKDFNAYESLCGSLTNLRVYDTLLTTKQMVSFTTCRTFTPEYPPILDLSNIEEQFSLQNVDVEIRQNEEYCDTQREFDAIFPELREFQDGARLCHVVGGEVKVPQNERENDKLFQDALEYVNICGEGYAETFWLGVEGDVDTQNWTHYKDHSSIDYKKINRDYGSFIEHPDTCMAFSGSRDNSLSNYGVWTPRACHLELCSVCSLDRIKLIRMRGLCRQSHFDRDYFLTYERESPAFAGVKYSLITKKPPNKAISDSEYGFWILNRSDKPQALAILDMKYPSHYPIGRNTWRVDNDVCGKDEVSLFMTSCLDRQFSCADGTCIDIQRRCDLEANCPDESDEVNCRYARMPQGYDNSNPPSRTGQSGAIKIYLQIDLLSLRHIDLANFKFTSEMNMHLRWTDNRLEYLHLNHDETLNIIDENGDLPWIPQINFQGDGNTTSTVYQRQRFIKVRRYSDPLSDNDENESEDEIFSGKSNNLVVSRKLTVVSSCDFNLGDFPFDRQTCSMVVTIVGSSKDYVALLPDEKGVTFLGERKLQEYYLVSEVMLQQNEGNSSGQAVLLTFNNLSTFYVISTYVPTYIIVIIGCLVFFFPVWSFNERIMVSLTGLLVEATFFSQVSATIPHTAYLKLVDTWFVFCILFLFLVVVALVIINWLQEESKVQPMQAWTLKDAKVMLQARATRFNTFCRLAFPLFASSFLVVYYITAAV